jgi:hypothetical protein
MYGKYNIKIVYKFSSSYFHQNSQLAQSFPLDGRLDQLMEELVKLTAAANAQVPLSDTVQLILSNNHPLVVEYTLADGAGSLRFCVEAEQEKPETKAHKLQVSMI